MPMGMAGCLKINLKFGYTNIVGAILIARRIIKWRNTNEK